LPRVRGLAAMHLIEILLPLRCSRDKPLPAHDLAESYGGRENLQNQFGHDQLVLRSHR
jgi:hypothetical protein